MKLGERIAIAEQNKPPMGAPCNSCGWCCMTAVCPMGQGCGAGVALPCKFLTGDHKCYLALHSPYAAEMIDAGGGCDARTINEQIKELFGSTSND